MCDITRPADPEWIREFRERGLIFDCPVEGSWAHRKWAMRQAWKRFVSVICFWR